MRCFIAIDIPNEIRAELIDLQKDLAGRVDIRRGDAKWVEPEGMHLTLKFLGEVPDNQVVEVCRIVQEVAERHEAFDFSVKDVGSFGGRSARVLWVGAGLDCPELLALQQDLEDELELAGWPREGRQFSGHLTLCRIRNVKAGEKLGRRRVSMETTIWALSGRPRSASTRVNWNRRDRFTPVWDVLHYRKSTVGRDMLEVFHG